MEWALLAALPADARAALVDAARRRSFGRGEIVFHEGDLGDSFHLVRTGRFAVRVVGEHGEHTTIRVLGPGDAFGELSLVRPPAGHRTATVTALEDADTLSISGGSFAALRARHPEVDHLLVRLLAERVEELSERLLEALYVGVDKRVFRRLAELAAVYGNGTDPPCIPLTQEDLAGLAGTSRPTVNQVLRGLAADGTVAVRRGTVVITDLARLQARAR